MADLRPDCLSQIAVPIVTTIRLRRTALRPALGCGRRPSGYLAHVHPSESARTTPSPALALVVLAVTLVLPLLGARLAERDLAQLWRFPPPLAVPVDYPRWSWLACGLLLAVLLLVVSPMVLRSRVASTSPALALAPRSRARIPSWGWLAVGWTIVWWILAWTRFDWFAPWQRYTFFPLWLGFILTVNAATMRRTGRTLMIEAPRRWLALFGVSAVFWWVFEWLNRFVRNWHYLGVEDFGPAAYALHATLCFSTVLPAVAAVREWMGSLPQFEPRLRNGPAWRWLRWRASGAMLFAAGAAALVCTGGWPLQAYPALWLAPLLLASGLGVMARRPGLWSELAIGDWRNAASWAAAALICGWFWELWNWHSAAKWIYTVPYVERWHVFEMPLLGYAGYYAFGLECALVASYVAPARCSADDPCPRSGPTPEASQK